MSCPQFISAQDLQAIAPARDLADLAILAEDLNALLAGRLPCLRDLDEAGKRQARAIIRMALRDTLRHDGAQSTTLAQGPFRKTVNYGSTRARDLVSAELLTDLARLCGTARPIDSDMYNVPVELTPPGCC